MSLVRIQYDSKDQPLLLAHWRAMFGEGPDVPDEVLFEAFLVDLVVSLEWTIARRTGRLGSIPPSGEWIFFESKRGCEHVPRRSLGYEVLLQAWDSGLPWEPDDVPREVAGAPEWLRRIIVVVWRGLA